MKIAISGSHRTGKSTLIEELQNLLPTYSIVDEPYYLLEEEGHEFPEFPSLEDFQLQLKRSVKSILESEEDQIFERCPADFLAYLVANFEPQSFDYQYWFSLVQKGMERLDLIVFMPIEDPDRVFVSEFDMPELRQRVDDVLRDILLENEWGEYGTKIIEVTGTPQQRSKQVLTWMKAFGTSIEDE